jgi:uncharacterized Tic20 family protein
MSDPVASDAGAGQAAALDKDAKTWGMVCHLAALAGFIVPFGNIAGPLIVWQLKKEQFPFVADQGKESLNFQITVSIAIVVSIGLAFILIGLLLLPLIGIANIVFVIIAALKASNGDSYRYPFALRLVK